MALASANGAHQGILAQALCCSNRKNVIDNKAADAKCDVRKHFEECGQKIEHSLDLALCFLGDFGTCQRFEFVGWVECLIDGISQLFVGQRTITLNQECIDKAWLEQKLGRGWLVEQSKCCTAWRTDVAIVGNTNEREFATSGLCVYANLVAQDEIAVVCRSLIEHHFGWAHCKAAFLNIP